MTSFLRLLHLFLFLPAAYASARISIRYFPFHPPVDGSIPQSCLDQGESLKSQLARFPHPDSWTFVIACDDRMAGESSEPRIPTITPPCSEAELYSVRQHRLVLAANGGAE